MALASLQPVGVPCMSKLVIADCPGPAVITHRITRTCDLSTWDARGLYSSLTSYVYGGRSPVACGAASNVLMPPGPVKVLDASANLHTIQIGEATGSMYEAIIPVMSGTALKLLGDESCKPQSCELPAEARVVRLTLSREASSIRITVEPFARLEMPVTEAAAAAMQRKPSASSLLCDDLPLFCGDHQEGSIRRVPSKDNIGG